MNSHDKSKKSGALRRPAKSNSLGILIILLAMCLLLTIAVGKKFLSASNLISVIRQFSFYGILAIGMCMVLIPPPVSIFPSAPCSRWQAFCPVWPSPSGICRSSSAC